MAVFVILTFELLNLVNLHNIEYHVECHVESHAYFTCTVVNLPCFNLIFIKS